jgi:hypothetical protein|tara:strand:- start:15 stop:515 length:501 start_codon:yes stop_codon:yes gene_type:complete
MAAASKFVRGALKEIKEKFGALPDNVVDATDIFDPPPVVPEQIPVESREFQNFMGISDEMFDLKNAGVKFFEKPSYFEDIPTGVNSSQIKSLESVANKKFNTYNINDILDDPKFPLSDLKKENLNPEDQAKGSSFIVFDPENQKRYLANTSGAEKYIRMWSNLNYD